MRIGTQALLGVWDADLVHRCDRDLGRLLVIHILVQQDRLDDLIADGIDGVETRRRLLEDHRDVFAAHLQHLLLAQAQQIAPVQKDRTALDAPRRLGNQLQDGQGGDGFSATGLTHQRESLSRVDRQAQAVHGLYVPISRSKRNR